MHALLVLLWMFAPPFWQVRQPAQWSDAEVERVLHDSPWAQTASPEPAVHVYLATAQPILDAEAELRIRGRAEVALPDPDYTEYASRNRESQLVLAIDYAAARKPWNPEDEQKMQAESVLLVGRRKHRMVGYFPPTPGDPVLRIAFPRDVRSSDRRLVFQLYLPGIAFPERDVQFDVKDLFYRGNLEL